MTRAHPTRPVKRIVLAEDRFGRQEYVVEITDRICTLRPKGTQSRGPQAIEVPWGALYLRAMIARAEEARRAKKRRRTT